MARIKFSKYKYVYCSWTLRTSLLPNKSNTWTMCSLPLVSGSCGAVVHKCARLCFGCARCARVSGMSLALTAVFSECFAKCAHICRMCRTLSQNSTRLGIRLTTRTSCARDQEKQLRTGFQPGEQKRALAPNPGAFPSGGKSGDFSGGARGRPGADLAIWPNLAPRRLF